MPPEFNTVFERLRGILQKHTGDLTVSEDTATGFCLSGPTGPATLQAWHGKLKSPLVPVALVRIGKAYVSYHLMALYGPSKLRDSLSLSKREIFRESSRLTRFDAIRDTASNLKTTGRTFHC